MLGNWVKRNVPYSDNNGICEVKSITSEYVGLHDDCVFDTLPCDTDGIEVTEELLIRIGFKKLQMLKDRCFFRYWDKDYRYKLDADLGFCNGPRKWGLHVDNDVCNTIGAGEFTYVHELQNLVRVVTGYELKIDKSILYGLDD